MIGGGIFALVCGLYAWQVHGWLGGILAAVAMIVLTIIANNIYIWRLGSSEGNHDDADGNKMLRRFQQIKWVIFGVIMAVIAVSGAELVTT